MTNVASIAGAAGLLLLTAFGAQAQVLSVTGPTGQTKAVTAQEIAGLPQVTFAFTHNGVTHTYSGPLLIDVLALVGTPTGPDIKDKALAHAVLARGADGYQVVFGLVELDPMARPNRTIVADKSDGAPLPKDRGPFQTVAEGDLRAARAIKQLVSVEVIALAKP